MRALLMGGQACVLYGAAEFSRDVDFAVAATPENLGRVRRALADLGAVPIYLPPLSTAALRRGHACHFRCTAAGLRRLRIDVMSRMRGVDPFARLWKRRRAIHLPGAGPVAVLAVPDLVRAKKTQRDKDWPMIRRLIEADVVRAGSNPGRRRVEFWLRECRSPELLCRLAALHAGEARRPAHKAAIRGNPREVERRLRREEEVERERDRRYWAPLQAQLERWRLGRPRG